MKEVLHKLIPQIIQVLLPIVLTMLILLLKVVGSYFGEKIKNSKLKNLWGWLNKEVVAAIERLKEDPNFNKELREAWKDGRLTDSEKKHLIETIKHDVLRSVPNSLIKEFQWLIGDIEEYVVRQIKFFFSQELQSSSEIEERLSLR